MNNYDRAKKISSDLISDIKYMYADHVIGILGTLVSNYGLPLDQDTIDGMKDALIDYFFDGFDPDWNSYGMWQWFENLNPSWFEIKNGTIDCNKSVKDFKKNK